MDEQLEQISERRQKVQDETLQVLSEFGDHFTNNVEVRDQKGDSADWVITIHKATGEDYQFTWIDVSGVAQRQDQLRKFLLHTKSDNLPSGSYDGRDYLPD